MVKAWIGADYLRRSAERGTTPPDADKADIETMIRDSDNAAADRIIAATGGGASESIGRLATMCQLTEVQRGREVPGNTVISARDAVRMGDCLADGRAAGAQWTPWVMDSCAWSAARATSASARRSRPDQQPRSRPRTAGRCGTRTEHWHVELPRHRRHLGAGRLQRYPSHGDRRRHGPRRRVCQDVITAVNLLVAHG